MWLEKQVLDKMTSNKRRASLLIDFKTETNDLPFRDGQWRSQDFSEGEAIVTTQL